MDTGTEERQGGRGSAEVRLVDMTLTVDRTESLTDAVAACQPVKCETYRGHVNSPKLHRLHVFFLMHTGPLLRNGREGRTRYWVGGYSRVL